MLQSIVPIRLQKYICKKRRGRKKEKPVRKGKREWLRELICLKKRRPFSFLCAQPAKGTPVYPGMGCMRATHPSQTLSFFHQTQSTCKTRILISSLEPNDDEIQAHLHWILATLTRHEVYEVRLSTGTPKTLSERSCNPFLLIKAEGPRGL